MKTYVIEREMPGIGKASKEDLKNTSKKSCGVIQEIGDENIKWLHSYVVANKVFCVYEAENERLLKQHAEKTGIPINSVHEVVDVISPKTAEA
ncbi:DUF4242 domain-containing protein [Gramella sp. BOM4]|nr:DUF4242 domain-containing protein [Christiangramia bathymodioli]